MSAEYIENDYRAGSGSQCADTFQWLATFLADC